MPCRHRVYVVFRGTQAENVRNWLTNLALAFHQFCQYSLEQVARDMDIAGKS